MRSSRERQAVGSGDPQRSNRCEPAIADVVCLDCACRWALLGRSALPRRCAGGGRASDGGVLSQCRSVHHAAHPPPRSSSPRLHARHANTAVAWARRGVDDNSVDADAEGARRSHTAQRTPRHAGKKRQERERAIRQHSSWISQRHPTRRSHHRSAAAATTAAAWRFAQCCSHRGQPPD